MEIISVAPMLNMGLLLFSSPLEMCATDVGSAGACLHTTRILCAEIFIVDFPPSLPPSDHALSSFHFCSESPPLWQSDADREALWKERDDSVRKHGGPRSAPGSWRENSLPTIRDESDKVLHTHNPLREHQLAPLIATLGVFPLLLRSFTLVAGC